MGLTTKLIGALGSAGRPGRELGVRLDVLRSTGVRYARQRRREEALLTELARDPRKSAYRVIWQQAADEVGAELRVIHGDFLELRSGAQRARVWRHWVPLDDAVTLRLALDKTAVHEILSRAGLPLPEHEEWDASQLNGAVEFLERSPTACVVKPTGGASGSGATTGVRTRDQLLRARLRAARLSRRLLIERQAEGDMYRLLFMDGELLDTVRRRPPRLTGDGRSTIRELIAAENAGRLDPDHPVSMPILRVDLDCLFTLEAAGLSLASVLPEGETIAVKTVTSQNRIEDNETVREPIDPGLVAEAREAAAQVGVRLAGVDLITPDLGRCLKESGGVVIEVNGTPGLHYHYQVADEANATPVAVPILRRLLEESRSDQPA
jgi:glutathione synthase/RimK-type ligase-like ATP-grasp enzyme